MAAQLGFPSHSSGSDFVFPARPISAQFQKRPSQPISQRRSMNALPSFSFSPAGDAPTSPEWTAAASAAPAGHHRRGRSEFIGASRSGKPIIVSQSPPARNAFDTEEKALVPPPLTPTHARRGHAHRRSAAISSHDLLSIIKAAEHSPSAPTSPLTSHEGQLASPDEPQSAPAWKLHHAPARSRVGFTDHVELIRPLSTISSVTEGSLSNSNPSQSAGSTPSKDSPVSFSADESQDHPRSSPHSQRRSPISRRRHDSTGSSLSPRLNQARLSLRLDTSIPPVPPIPSDMLTGNVTLASPVTSLTPLVSSPTFPFSMQSSRPSRPSSARLSPDMPTQSLSFLDPLTASGPSLDPSPLDCLDVDNTVTLVSDGDCFSPPAVPHPKLDSPSLASQPTTPTIDLDDALAPYSANDSTNSRQSRARRFMHSGTSPVHRRAESAPEINPFDPYSQYVVRSMDDVSEEEEDNVDEHDASKSTDRNSDSTERASESPTSTLKGSPVPAIREEDEDEEEVEEPVAALEPFVAATLPEEQSATVSVVASRSSYPTTNASASITVDGDLPRPQLPVSFLQNVPGSPSFSSPTLSSEPSLDTPRIGTAASSLADYRVNTSGGRSFDIRLSIDEQSPLPHRASAMMHSLSHADIRGARTSSACSSNTRVTDSSEHYGRHRSSLISLSRLMSGSTYGDRTKSPVTGRPHSTMTGIDGGSFKKKPSRLSRVIRFLRPREREQDQKDQNL